MKRIHTRLLLVLFITLFFVGFIPNRVSADVNDFGFSSFDADYYLSKDDEGRSTMRVIERLTAEFKNYNQNKGINRAIPIYYDGHNVSFKFESLMRNGQPEPIYEQKRDGEFEIVSTGTNEYLNGTQKYTFTYMMRDVTKDFSDHQELYWDTNGTGWDQQFDSVTARVHLDDSINNAFKGEVSCYQGPEYSNEKCNINVSGGDITFSSTKPLSRHENLSFSLSFKAGTFAGYKMTLGDMVPYGLLVGAFILFIVMILIKLIYGKNDPGRGTIVPEYLPPKNTSVLMSAEIFDKPKNATTAQIIDLAVRHKIRIEEAEKRAFIGNRKEYTLELLNIDGLDKDELSFVSALFNGTQLGGRYTFKKNDNVMAMKMQQQAKSVKEESVKAGYRQKNTKLKLAYRAVMAATVAVAAVAIFIFVSNQDTIGIFLGIGFFIIFAILFTVFKLHTMRPLTASGRGLLDYLKGLKIYIKLAEEKRLKVLQSAEGTEKRQINTDDKAKMVVLYERVLPYAVLFGQEKSWLKQLGLYYENAQMEPDWYSGMGVFNAAAFASAVSSFSSYAGSSSFSSSSGAGGGGFSGGGGGGGGGGGR